MFQLADNEFKVCKSQIVISNSNIMSLRKRPFAFTEHGVAKLASVRNKFFDAYEIQKVVGQILWMAKELLTLLLRILGESGNSNIKNIELPLYPYNFCKTISLLKACWHFTINVVVSFPCFFTLIKSEGAAVFQMSLICISI